MERPLLTASANLSSRIGSGAQNVSEIWSYYHATGDDVTAVVRRSQGVIQIFNLVLRANSEIGD